MEESKWQEVKDFVFATYANENRIVSSVEWTGYWIVAGVKDHGQQKLIRIGGFADVLRRAQRHRLSVAKRFRVHFHGELDGHWLFSLKPDDEHGTIASADDLLEYLAQNNAGVAKAMISDDLWDCGHNDVKLLLEAGFDRCADWCNAVCYILGQNKED